MELDLAGLLLLRVNQQVVHGWDVHVALDPGATLFSAGVALMMDGLGRVAARGTPTHEAQVIAVTTEGPGRRFLLAIGPNGPSLTDAGEGDIKATLRLPAEAFVRLLYGRLDPAHTPPVQTEGVDLDLLRGAFPFSRLSARANRAWAAYLVVAREGKSAFASSSSARRRAIYRRSQTWLVAEPRHGAGIGSPCRAIYARSPQLRSPP